MTASGTPGTPSIAHAKPRKTKEAEFHRPRQADKQASNEEHTFPQDVVVADLRQNISNPDRARRKRCRPFSRRKTGDLRVDAVRRGFGAFD
jgi:hypothetical protein